MIDIVELDDGTVRKAKLEMALIVRSNSVKSLPLRGIKSGINYFIDNLKE